MSTAGAMQIEVLSGGTSLGAVLRRRLDDSLRGGAEGERARTLSIFVGSLDVFRGLGRADAAHQPAPEATAEAAERHRFLGRMMEAHRCHRTILSVGYWRSSLYIGPFFGDHRPGCPRCLLTRFETSNAQELGNAARVRVDENGGLGLWGPIALRTAAELVNARISDWCRDAEPREPMITVFHQDGTARSYPLIPDSMCALCGAEESNTYPSFEARGEWLESDRGTEGHLRQRSLASIDVDRYVSPFGLLGVSRVDLQSPFGASSLELPSKLRPPEPAIGRARSYGQSRVTAILEGLERFCGLYRGGRRAVTRASFRDLAGQAVCPKSMGLHPVSSYAQDGFPYSEFSEDIEVDWVEAYSFAHEGPRYVPERAAFWGPRNDGERSFFFETSNGCSLGSSLEEATLHGLRELVERDSFLVTWYRQLELPEIDLDAERDPELKALLRRCELFTGFRFRAFWSTMGFGMSSVWLVAINDSGSGPCVLAGGAAHPNPRKAIIAGLYELCGVVLATTFRYSSIRESSLEMIRNPALIRRMEDHSNVACLPEARDRFSFLIDRDEKPVELDELNGMTTRASVRTHLESVIRALREHGIDVLVVDQTMPEVASAGFHCVKVIAPGLLPMTFGHMNRRTRYLDRLTDVAVLPYASRLPPDAEIGQVPHPFP